MKIKKLLLSISIFSLFTLFAFSEKKAVPLFLEEKTSAESFVNVRTNVSGASVYIDGSYKGTTPLTSIKIQKGYHSLRVTKSRYTEETLNFHIRDGETENFYINLELNTGWVNVSSKFSDLEIYIDGNRSYQTSNELEAGSHTIKARKFGYEDYERSFYLSRNQTLNLDIEMTKAKFKITSITASKKVFNPENKGSLGNCLIKFSVNAPATGYLEIKDSLGNIYLREKYEFTTWDYEYEWDGADNDGYILYDDIYTITLFSGNISSSCKVEINSSLNYHALTMTNDGSGLGNAALPLALPSKTIIFGFNSGAYITGPVTTEKNSFYGIPLDIFLAFSGQHFELGFQFKSLFKEEKSLGFAMSLKYQNQVKVADKTSFNYGINLRIAGATNPLFEPFGADAGSGFGAGLMAGFDINGLYIGANSNIIFLPISVTSGDGSGNPNERLWKNTITLAKNSKHFETAVYASLISSFGRYSTESSLDNLIPEQTTVSIYDPQRAWETGFNFNLYLGASSHLLNFAGGLIIYPEVNSYTFAKLGLTFLFS